MSNESAGTLLVVEDEKNVGSTLVERLKREGYDVTWVTTAADARDCFGGASAPRFDLVILDVGLPDDSGFTVAEHIRDVSAPTAILFLTAFGSPENRVRGLELGAEDYVVKPFHLQELLLRIRNALRRARTIAQAEQSVRIGRAIIHFPSFEAEVNGERLTLTHKECALLRLLVERRGQVVSRDEILEQVWGAEEYPTTRTVDNFILRLRKIIEPSPETPEHIRSVRGVGYQLV